MKRFALCLALALVGCKSKPPEAPLPDGVKECREQALECRRQAEDARSRHDADSAARAAARADALARHAQQLTAPASADADAPLLIDIQNARALCQEEVTLTKKLSGWSAKGYRAGRNAALATCFKALAIAARRAKDQDISKLDPAVQDLVKLAAELAWLLKDKAPPAEVDWEEVATELETIARDRPARLGQVLTLGLLVTGKTDWTLAEAQLLDSGTVRAGSEKSFCHILRGVAFSRANLPRLAVEEAERAASHTQELAAVSAAETLGLIHLVCAVLHLQEQEFAKADRELTMATRVWANNPLAVFLTGEILAADGRTEQAADSVEQLARGTSQEQLARKLAQRARDVREGKRSSLLNDPALLIDLLFMTHGSEPQSPIMKAYARSVAAAEGLARKVGEYLP